MSFWLEYFDNGQKREFSFDAHQVSVGRDKAADFVLDHPTVSRQHAVIVAEPQGAKLVVLSRGGLTAINGQQVSGEVQLFDGSQIHFGQLAFTFRSHASQQPQQGHQHQAPQQPMQQMQQPQQPQVQQPPQADSWAPAADAWSSGAGFDQAGDAKIGRRTGMQDAIPSPELPPPGAKEFPDPNTGGIKSWDEIAAGADEEDSMDLYGTASNFERLQAASKKADAQSKGNPIVLIGGVVLAAGMLTWSFWPAAPTKVKVQNNVDERPEISWMNTDIKCSVPADCKAQAIQSYMFASETFDKKDVDVANLYVAYKNMDKATKLLEQGSISEPVPELDGLENKKAAALVEINERFKQLQIKYKNFEKRKMYRDMAMTLNEVQAYFPDKRHKKNLWAVLMERDMRDKGIYPNTL